MNMNFDWLMNEKKKKKRRIGVAGSVGWVATLLFFSENWLAINVIAATDFVKENGMLCV